MSCKKETHIAVTTGTKEAALVQAQELLRSLAGEHVRGEDWPYVDDAPAAGLGVLKKIDAITVIKIDGAYRAQIKGAIKDA